MVAERRQYRRHADCKRRGAPTIWCRTQHWVTHTCQAGSPCTPHASTHTRSGWHVLLQSFGCVRQNKLLEGHQPCTGGATLSARTFTRRAFVSTRGVTHKKHLHDRHDRVHRAVVSSEQSNVKLLRDFSGTVMPSA